MTTHKIHSSGISKPRSGKIASAKQPLPKSKLPQVLPYQKLHQFDKVTNHLRDRLCYVIRHYGHEGLSVLISRQPKQDSVAVLFGDWQGNNIDLDKTDNKAAQLALLFIKEDLKLFLQVMHTIKLQQAQFFLTVDEQSQLFLVDVQLSLNKLAGPGMIRDIFGKIYKTQDVLKLELINDQVIECINNNTGTYAGDLIIKPSKFSIIDGDDISALYAEIKR